MPWAMKLRKAAMKASGSTFTGGCAALGPAPAAAAAAAAVDAQPPSAVAVPGAGRLRMGEGVLSGSLPLVPMHVNTLSSSNLNCGQSKPWEWVRARVERKERGQTACLWCACGLTSKHPAHGQWMTHPAPISVAAHLGIRIIHIIHGCCLIHVPQVAQAVQALERHAVGLQVRQQAQPVQVVLQAKGGGGGGADVVSGDALVS